MTSILQKEENFCIKPGYKANSALNTMDHISGVTYWNAERLISSHYYQFDVYRYAANLAKKIKAKTLIDVGCGVASKLSYIHKRIPSLSIIGVDQSDPIIYCRKTYDFGTWQVDDFENPQLDKLPANPDIIISADVIEHLDNPDNLLAYIQKIAIAETYIIISTPERDYTRGEECFDCPHTQHVREWNKAELSVYLQSRGFEILEHFMVSPFKLNLRPRFVLFKIRQMLSGRRAKNNQVVLLKLKDVE